MANEMTVTLKVSYASGSDEWSKSIVSSQHDVAGTDRAGSTMQVTNSAANIPQGNVGTPGFCYFKNLDASLTIQIGFDSSGFVTFLTMPPGVEQWVYLNHATPQALASAAGPALLEYQMFEA